MINYIPFGDSAILINFDQRIDPGINQQVISLVKKMEQSPIFGVAYCIPAYCSLTVGFDGQKVNYERVVADLTTLISQKKEDNGAQFSENKQVRKLRIPVCYEKGFAIDLEEIQTQTGLSYPEIIDKHTANSYRVYMIGFLPGFPYLGILPKVLACQRKAIPRQKVAAQSVALAGLQTGIYPSDAPGGWQIIGKTPLQIFQASAENPFLFQTGDEVNFYSISLSSFQKIEKDLAKNTFNLNQIYG